MSWEAAVRENLGGEMVDKAKGWCGLEAHKGLHGWRKGKEKSSRHNHFLSQSVCI